MMPLDTRHKIVSAEEAIRLALDLHRQGCVVRVVTGYFDLLLAEHVRRLEELAQGESLFTVVLDHPGALLSVRARAELLAALAVVRCVAAVEGPQVEDFLRRFAWREIVREEETDGRRLQAFIEHVHRRQRVQ